MEFQGDDWVEENKFVGVVLCDSCHQVIVLWKIKCLEAIIVNVWEKAFKSFKYGSFLG